MTTFEEVKNVLDQYFFIKSEMGPPNKFSDIRKTLVYRSPSGVELFRLTVSLTDEGWLYAGITHSLSDQCYILEDISKGDKDYVTS